MKTCHVCGGAGEYLEHLEDCPTNNGELPCTCPPSFEPCEMCLGTRNLIECQDCHGGLVMCGYEDPPGSGDLWEEAGDCRHCEGTGWLPISAEQAG